MTYAKNNKIDTNDEKYLEKVSGIYSGFKNLQGELEEFGLDKIQNMLELVSGYFEKEIFEQIKKNPE